MKFLLLIVTVFIFTIPLFSQDMQEADSLELRLIFENDPEKKVELLEKISRSIKFLDIKKAQEYAEQALAISNDIGNETARIMTNIFKSFGFNTFLRIIISGKESAVTLIIKARAVPIETPFATSACTIGIVPAAFFFGLLIYGADMTQRLVGVPANMIQVLQGIIILTIVATKMVLANPYLMQRVEEKLFSASRRGKTEEVA